MSELAKNVALFHEPLPKSLPVPEPSLLGVIARAVLDPSFDVVKLDHLLAIQERLEAKQAEERFDEAMAAAQSEMHTIVSNKDNVQTKSRYANLAQVNRAIRPIYSKHGFALSFDAGDGAPEGWIRVLCYVSAKGHRRVYHKDLPADGKGAKGNDVMSKTHAVASADTYARRYLLCGIFNLAIGEEEDDDGNAAGAVEIVTVDDNQMRHIFDLLKILGGDMEQRFCHRFGITHVAELPAKEFERAIRLLQDTKANREKGARQK